MLTVCYLDLNTSAILWPCIFYIPIKILPDTTTDTMANDLITGMHLLHSYYWPWNVIETQQTTENLAMVLIVILFSFLCQNWPEDYNNCTWVM